MSITGLAELLRGRWWLVVAAVALGLSASAVYALQQRQVYESTTTEFVRLSETSAHGADQGVIEGELGLLSYGSLVNTIVSIAESRATMSSAATNLDFRPGRLDRYHAVVTVRPQSFVLDISVDGPNQRLVAVLATRLAATLAGKTSANFPVFGLSSLAPASAGVQVRPKLRRDLVYGGAAGLLLGLVLAGLRSSSTPAHVLGRDADDPVSPTESPAGQPG